MPSPRGADPEHNMREALMYFIKENRDQVNTIAALFLKKKKLSLDEYIQFMSTPGNQGDELATSPCHNALNILLYYYEDKHILQPPECIPQSFSCIYSTCVLKEQRVLRYYDSQKKMPTSTPY